jgi:hypothetical protein
VLQCAQSSRSSCSSALVVVAAVAVAPQHSTRSCAVSGLLVYSGCHKVLSSTPASRCCDQLLLCTMHTLSACWPATCTAAYRVGSVQSSAVHGTGAAACSVVCTVCSGADRPNAVQSTNQRVHNAYLYYYIAIASLLTASCSLHQIRINKQRRSPRRSSLTF